MKEKSKSLELKVGAFSSIGLGLMLMGVWMLGNTHKIFAAKQTYYLALPNAEGVVSGAAVFIAGVSSGTVEDVRLEAQKQGVKIKMNISANSAESIRQDSTAEISSHGVLGDKVVMISAGNPSLPKLAPGSEIPAQTTSTFTNLFGRPGDRLLVTLNEVASHLNRMLISATKDGKSDLLINNLISASEALTKSANLLNDQLTGIKLKEAVGNLNSILGKADHGSGTVSGVLNDSQLYDDAKALFGEVNHNRIVRNLVRKSVEDGYNQEDSQQKAGTVPSK